MKCWKVFLLLDEKLPPKSVVTFVQHFVSFVEHQNFDASSPEGSPLDHIKHSSRRPADYVLAVVQLADVFAEACAANTSVTLDVHQIAQGEDDLGSRKHIDHIILLKVLVREGLGTVIQG